MRFRPRNFFPAISAAPVLLGHQAMASQDTEGPICNNTSSFRVHDWQDHFDTLGLGIIICDTTMCTLQHWATNGDMSTYPTSVLLTETAAKTSVQCNPGLACSAFLVLEHVTIGEASQAVGVLLRVRDKFQRHPGGSAIDLPPPRRLA